MHILVVNDDGPPSNQSSPYVHSLVSTLQSVGHTVSVVLPNVQRSWIGKAHIIGQTLTPTYFRPGTLHEDDGITSEKPFNDGKEEWVLVDGTPASCAQIGMYHVFKERGSIDLVLSGPNYGRNTTAVFSLSSGTIGGALEGAICGFKSIALSYAFDSRNHDPEIIAAASRLSTRLVEKLMTEWPEDVDLYSLNVPLRKGVEDTKIMYTEILQNRWKSGSSFEEIPAEEENEIDAAELEKEVREAEVPNGEGDTQHPREPKEKLVKYKWAPQFADIRDAVQTAQKGDGWAVLNGWVSVTPLKANFWHIPAYKGEIKLALNPARSALEQMDQTQQRSAAVYALIDYPEPYVQPLIKQALSTQFPSLHFEFISSPAQLPSPDLPLLQFTAYESLDFGHAMGHPRSSLLCAYVIRKALIRKHYLSNTVSSWLVKNPGSVLQAHFMPAIHFEVDFAEFLDEALVDAWDLNESLARNEESGEGKSEKEWWILKPGMSDGGNGIRLFSSMEELSTIFEGWEVDEDDEGEDGDEPEEIPTGECREIRKGSDETGECEQASESGLMASQLRHFIAQPYIAPPLLLEDYSNRKFHIRVYVVAVGALKVLVYREMLALFAAKPYQAPTDGEDGTRQDLACHLTNTCFQDESTRDGSVHRFWTLKDAPSLAPDWKERIYEQICEVTGEIFEAAAREQMVHFQAIPNAFEIFGVDFLVDAELRVWLLELNAYPDFKQTGEELQDVVVGGLFAEVAREVIVPFFGGKASIASESRKLRPVRAIDLGRG